MEVGCLTFTSASSALPRTATALTASHCRGTSIICQPNHQLSPIRTTIYSDNSQITSSTTSRSKGNLIVRATNQKFSTRNWDVSNYAAPSWLPRFEELDTTNMLLRQRIIFLGTQEKQRESLRVYIQAGQWTPQTLVKSSNTGIAVDLKIPLILDAQQYLMLLTMIDAARKKVRS